MGTFTMPSLGADMEAGTLVEWLKQPGDAVHRGDIVAVVETEKGAIEVEIFEDGRLETLLVEPGRKVPVGTPLAVIAGAGGEAAAEKPAPPPSAPAPSVPIIVPAAAPAPPPPSAGAPRTSPAARKRALELGLSLASIKGSGAGGAVVLDDVEAAAQGPAGAPRGIDLSQMRRAIAAAMARSKREIPHYYLSHNFDLTNARETVETYNAEQSPENRILIGALLVKSVAVAVREFPEFNGFHDGTGFRPSPSVHVGLAISIRGGGLAAPAIHDTDRLAVPELMTKMRDLISRVRRGGFRSSEISDPTITVSSLGDRGVDDLYPIIYPPQVAIVGFGTPAKRPWVVNGSVDVRTVIAASLGADHRVSDGHRGALFLLRIAELLQQPDQL